MRATKRHIGPGRRPVDLTRMFALAIAALAAGAAYARPSPPRALPSGVNPQPSPPPVPQPELPEIRPGASVQSTLDGGQTDADGHPYRDYRLQLRERQVVQIDLESPPPSAAPAQQSSEGERAGFDTYLEIRPLGGGAPLAANDDRLGSLNSRLTFAAPADGVYIVRARAFFQGAGDYLLTVTQLLSEPEPAPFVDNRAGGDMGAGSRTREDYSAAYHYAFHSFGGTAGDRVQLATSAPEGSNLYLFDDARRLLALNIGGVPGSRLFAVLPRFGTYLVRVDVPIAWEGSYTIDLTRTAALPPPLPRMIGIGDQFTGQLAFATSGVGVAPNRAGAIDYFYQLFVLQVTAGQVLTATVDTPEGADRFDPLLDAGDISVLGFASAATDDDSGGNLNSRLVLRPLRAGRLYLRVRSLGPRTGAFTLRVVEGVPPPTP